MNYQTLSKILGIGSIVLLIGGVILILIKRKFKTDILPFGYLLALSLLEITAYYLSDFHSSRLNIYILYLSGFIHFFFIILIFHNYYRENKRSSKLLLISLGIVLFFLAINSYEGFNTFHIYGNVLYNLIILSFSLSHFMTIIINGIKPLKHELLINSAILLYFSFDCITSLTSNYLINEHLDLVAPFWLIRTVLLQFFYFSLINFTWQIGKTQKQ